MKITRKAADWLWDAAADVVRFGFHNKVVKTVETGHDKVVTWNHRDARVLDAASSHFDKSHAAYRAATARTPLLRAAAGTATWAVASAASAVGTGITRFTVGAANFVATRGVQLVAIAPVVIVGAGPLVVAGLAVETVNVGAYVARTARNFAGDVKARWDALGKKSKAAAAPAVDAVAVDAVEGPAPIAVAAPAVEAAAAPAVEAAAAPAVEVAGRPAAPQPRLAVTARSVTRSISGLGE